MLRRKTSNLGSPATNASGADSARSAEAPRSACATEPDGSVQKSPAGDHPQALEDVRRSFRWNDPSLYVLAFVIGVIPIIAVLVRGGSWGAEPTIGLVFCVIFRAALVQHGLDRKFRGHGDCVPRPPEPSGSSGDKQTWSLT